MTVPAATLPSAPIELRRWPGERFWFALTALFAVLIWILLAASVVGLIYAVLLGIFFFLAHTVFITHVRGSGVRLGAAQLPDLHARVARMARRLGLKDLPEAYLMQAGGSLNALATKFLGRECIVLYSDLVDACGDNGAALDFIVAHELAHLRAGHLRLRWLLLPGLFVPLLGGAYSRACEYTADGAALDAAGRSEAALQGLVILAAGGKLAGRIDTPQLIAQSDSLNTPWMKLGQWLSSHPPISRRLAALLDLPVKGERTAALGAIGILLLGIGLPAIGGVALVKQLGPQMQAALRPPAAAPAHAAAASTDERRREVEEGILGLAQAAETARAQGALPADGEGLYTQWQQSHPGQSEPRDPHTGERYAYETGDGHYRLWSPGPDRRAGEDDLYYDSRQATR
jgi:Zn-dependent protease with chaperone function